MAFWKVAGFAQPSPIEVGGSMHARQVPWKWLQWGLTTPMLPLQQILDKETFTLEELLDEDDLIQECKSLNGRLVN
jgi:hypothetical protein